MSASGSVRVLDGPSREGTTTRAAWDVTPGGGLAAIERYREECALADQAIAGAPSE